jgi:hypothetical protein
MTDFLRRHMTMYEAKDCGNCDRGGGFQRDERDSTEPEIHYGIIASGNTLVKAAGTRDKIVEDIGEECICFEMEAADESQPTPMRREKSDTREPESGSLPANLSSNGSLDPAEICGCMEWQDVAKLFCAQRFLII